MLYTVPDLVLHVINHLTPNGHFSGRTAPLTYRCCIFLFIQQIYVEDVRNYWMTLSTGEDTLIWRRKLYIALCGGIVLEEALDLSSDRIPNEWIIASSDEASKFNVISERANPADKFIWRLKLTCVA
jgi:hypothetical protein